MLIRLLSRSKEAEDGMQLSSGSFSANRNAKISIIIDKANPLCGEIQSAAIFSKIIRIFDSISISATVFIRPLLGVLLFK